MLLNYILPKAEIVAEIGDECGKGQEFWALNYKLQTSGLTPLNTGNTIDNTQVQGEYKGVIYTITDSNLIETLGYTVRYSIGNIRASRFIPYSKGVIDFRKDCELVKSRQLELEQYPILDDVSIVYLVLEGQKIGARYSKPGIKPIIFSKPPTIAQLKGRIQNARI
jgi:hypothetical protein